MKSIQTFLFLLGELGQLASFVPNVVCIWFAWNKTTLANALLRYFGFGILGGVLGCISGAAAAYYICEDEPVRTIPPIMVMFPLCLIAYGIIGINLGCCYGLVTI